MKILFATDGSESAATALEFLLSLPLRRSDRVDVLAVTVRGYAGIGADGTGAFLAEIAEQETETARAVARDASARFAKKGIETSALVEEGPAPQAIISVARSTWARLIVVGSRGRGQLAGMLLGSTARAVARHSPIPVLVVRDRREAPRRILVAADGSEDAYAAITTLNAIPLPRGVEVTMVHVFPDRPADAVPVGANAEELRAMVERQERQDALRIFSHARRLLPEAAAVRMELERGRPAGRIIEMARGAGTDMIVIGARGTTLGREGFLQGSSAERILEEAHCAVLVASAPKHVSIAEPRNGEIPVGAGR